MGNGGFSAQAYATSTRGYATSSVREVFQETTMNQDMNPHGVFLRESCDSEEHPNTVPIIIALDVTGSMGVIPHYIVSKGLPLIMSELISAGIQDPQIMFMAIGDHEYDRAPLQIGQFESNDELLHKWLTSVYVESGGGGNNGESYFLAWLFASKHTEIDSFNKRGKKGFLFTIGDEPTLRHIDERKLQKIMGYEESTSCDAHTALEEARKKYHVFHLHMKEGSNGQNPQVMSGWKELIQDGLVIIENKKDISDTIINKILTLSNLHYQSNETEYDCPEEFKTSDDDSGLLADTGSNLGSFINHEILL